MTSRDATAGLRGKRTQAAVYVHVSGLDALPPRARATVDAAERAAGVRPRDYNIVKFSRDGRTVSLLSYPYFFEHGFPRLHQAWTVSSSDGRAARRVYGDNRPVLHRKEATLPVGHPAIPSFAALTRRAERLGLLRDAHEVGNERAWEARLRSRDLRVVGHRIVPSREGGGPR